MPRCVRHAHPGRPPHSTGHAARRSTAPATVPQASQGPPSSRHRMPPALPEHFTILCQQTAQPVYLGRAHFYQLLANPVHCQNRLLPLALDRNSLHFRLLRRHVDCARISRIVLFTHTVGVDGHCDGSVKEGLHALVNLLAQPGYLAFRHPLMPIALTRSSMDRVEIPWMQASWITAASAFPAVRRGSRSRGK